MSAALTSVNSELQTEPATRLATEADFPQIWAIFHKILQGQDTYTLPANYPENDAKDYWFGPSMEGKERHYVTRVAVIGDEVVGAYAVRPCYPVGGACSKVANASYIVAENHRGKGIAGKMGKESLIEAKKLGYTKMQYNQVVSTNAAAVKVWERLGMRIVGRSPGAFTHQDGTEADLLIMNKTL